MVTQIIIGLMALGVLVAGFAFYHQSVYDDGYDAAKTKYEEREKTASEKAERALAAAIKAEQDKATALQATINDISTRRQREQDHANAELQTLRAGVAAGTRRVSVPSVSPRPLFGSTAPAVATAAARTQPEARCELAPAAAAAILDIASDGDAAIRQSNALIDVYNAARGQQ